MNNRATKEEHLAKATGNETLALSLALDNQTNIDWALTILFYSAVHYVEAYFALSGQHLKSHTTRDSWIGRDSALKRIFNEYQDLKFYGYNARYEVSDFKVTDVRDVAIKAHATIKAYIETFV